MTKWASAVGRAAVEQGVDADAGEVVSNFDHVVTQWMSPRYSDGGSACASSHVQVVGVSTWPSTVISSLRARSGASARR